MKVTLKIFGLLLATFVSVSVHAAVTLLEESKVTNEGLYFWYPNGVKSYHYNPNISPRGDSMTVVNGYIYFGWFKGGMKNRNLMISRKKIGSGQWVNVQLPHKNTLIGPAVNGWGDSHKTISVGVSKIDGTVHVFYDHHNDPLKYIVSKKNIAFAPDAEFKSTNFEKTRTYLAEGQDIRITYPKITQNEKGEVMVNYRKGSAVGGNEMVHVYNGNTWTKSVQVTRGGGKPHVADEDKNYAYGKPAYGNGDVYYAFSVRWAAKKASGVLNEGLYLAKTGPKMTDQWEDPKGVKHKLPIQDYSPFLVAMPPSNANKGSSGGPGIAVSENGDIHLTYNGRGSGNRYQFTYTRKAGEQEFTRHDGTLKDGLSWDNRFYKASASGKKITISSGKPGSVNYRTDLVLETERKFGVSSYYIADGKLVMIISQDKAADKKDIYSYVFQLPGDATPSQPEPETPDYTPPAGFTEAAKAGDMVQVTGTMDIAFGANGQFNYLRNQTENRLCHRDEFGDPAPGVVKKCYVKTVAATTPEPKPEEPELRDDHCTVAAIGWSTAQDKFKAGCADYTFNKCEAKILNDESWVVCSSKQPPIDYIAIVNDQDDLEIQAEDYSRAVDVSEGNKGGVYRSGSVDIEATGDSNGDYHVAWINAADNLSYDILVSKAGLYSLSVRAANAGETAHVTISQGDEILVSEQPLASTASDLVFETTSFELGELAEGSQTLTFSFNADINFNWFKLTYAPTPDVEPETPTPEQPDNADKDAGETEHETDGNPVDTGKDDDTENTENSDAEKENEADTGKEEEASDVNGGESDKETDKETDKEIENDAGKVGDEVNQGEADQAKPNADQSKTLSGALPPKLVMVLLLGVAVLRRRQSAVRT